MNRITQAEARAKLEAEQGGLTCTHCGCRDFRVTSTWRVRGGEVHRQRVCRHCGETVIYTRERAYDPPAHADPAK